MGRPPLSLPWLGIAGHWNREGYPSTPQPLFRTVPELWRSVLSPVLVTRSCRRRSAVLVHWTLYHGSKSDHGLNGRFRALKVAARSWAATLARFIGLKG